MRSGPSFRTLPTLLSIVLNRRTSSAAGRGSVARIAVRLAEPKRPVLALDDYRHAIWIEHSNWVASVVTWKTSPTARPSANHCSSCTRPGERFDLSFIRPSITDSKKPQLDAPEDVIISTDYHLRTKMPESGGSERNRVKRDFWGVRYAPDG
jgi:hypothetical protein